MYLVGGHDGTGATDTLLRAQVLDPLATPEIADLDATPGDGTDGLEGGQWFYRVAAVFGNGNASNPGGESLPGEILITYVPELERRTG